MVFVVVVVVVFFLMMLLAHRMPFALVSALLLAASDRFMVLGRPRAWSKAVDFREGVNVDATVDPGAPPRCSTYEDSAMVPIEAADAPSPGAEEAADADAEAEADGATDDKSGPRSKEDHRRIVVGNYDEARIHRHDADVRAAADNDLSVAAQVSEASRAFLRFR